MNIQGRCVVCFPTVYWNTKDNEKKLKLLLPVWHCVACWVKCFDEKYCNWILAHSLARFSRDWLVLLAEAACAWAPTAFCWSCGHRHWQGRKRSSAWQTLYKNWISLHCFRSLPHCSPITITRNHLSSLGRGISSHSCSNISSQQNFGFGFTIGTYFLCVFQFAGNREDKFRPSILFFHGVY